MASYVTAIREQLGIESQLEEGRRGQFDVLVDDRVVVTRKGGLIAKFTGKPWPSVEDVVAAVKSGE